MSLHYNPNNMEYCLFEREFDVRKVLKKLWEWDIFSNFIGDNQTVTTKYPFP